MLHGYRQFMLRNVWLISLMNATLFLLSVRYFFINIEDKNVSDKLYIKG